VWPPGSTDNELMLNAGPSFIYQRRILGLAAGACSACDTSARLDAREEKRDHLFSVRGIVDSAVGSFA